MGAFHLGQRAEQEPEPEPEQEQEPEISSEEENPIEELDKSQEYYDSSLGRLGRVINEFPDTVAANYAYLYSGHCFYQMKEFNKAAEAYEKFIERSPEQSLKMLAYPKLGWSYEEMENYENALDYYLNLLKINNISTKEFAYKGAARCYEKIGDTQKALETYQAALDKYPYSLGSLNIRKKIASLKEKIIPESPQKDEQWPNSNHELH